MLNVQSLTQRTFAQIVVFALLLLNSTLAFAQNQVNGIVTDKTGEPLIGVNVVEKGTTNGVITDFNGQFTLNVAQGKTLGKLPTPALPGSGSRVSASSRSQPHGAPVFMSAFSIAALRQKSSPRRYIGPPGHIFWNKHTLAGGSSHER